MLGIEHKAFLHLCTWSLNENEAGVDFVSMLTSFLISDIGYREDICLQTLLLLFKDANHENKRSFVSTANEALQHFLLSYLTKILSVV